MSKPEAADEAMIAEFLEMARPDGQFVLGAIPCGGGAPIICTFGDPHEAAKWAASANAQEAHNLYWTDNRLRGPADSKPKEEDVEEVLFFHVDADPKPPQPDASADELVRWNTAERERIFAALRSFEPTPTFIVNSGGGYQAFWRLREPQFVGGARNAIDNFKPYNIELRNRFGADNCQSLDHLMRLPGTVNWPDDTKRRKGRMVALAEVVFRCDESYDVRDFTAAPPDTSKASRTGASVQLPSSIQFIGTDDLPADLSDKLRNVIIHGDDPAKLGGYQSKSEGMWFATCEMVRLGKDDGFIAGVLLNPELGVSDHPLRQKNSVAYVARQIERAREDNGAGGRRVLNPAAPFRIAQRLKEELYPDAIHTNDDWLQYARGAYHDVEDSTVRSRLYTELDAAVVRKKDANGSTLEPFNPDTGKVNKVVDALEGIAHVPSNTMAPPVWLDGDGPPPLEIVSCRNGLVHVPTGELIPSTPRFFTRNALDIEYQPDAPTPGAFLDWLSEVWPDSSFVELVQEMFGYLMLPDTSQEKIFLMIGPPRSGKGTMQKLLTELIGPGNVCNPSINSLGKPFGLQPLIGKQVAFMGDIRIPRGSEGAAATEALLGVSGQDAVTIDRKHKEAWTGRLPTRFVASSNELPKLKDTSPALANRFLPIIMERSFLDREDPTLLARLLPELPSIFNWSRAGLLRLRERGRFNPPAASREAINEMLLLGSHTAAFIHDRCELGPNKWVPKDDLFRAWKNWCDHNSIFPGEESVFARDLMTATNRTVKGRRVRVRGERIQIYAGIDLVGGGEPSEQLELGEGQTDGPY